LEKVEKELEEAKNQRQFARDIKTLEIEYHAKKLDKWASQREALSEQIRIKQTTAEKQKEARKAPSENPHARSESLLELYKKEKAKQLYQEQLDLMKQKKAFEKHVAEIDREHSIERLILARKELEKDIKIMKIAKYQQRKSLEEYWKGQMNLKRVRAELA
jgi:hypothetical protein